jgi:hypothetical protein
MKVALVGLYDRGVLDKERVHFRATSDLDLSFFVVLDSIYVSPTTIQPWNRFGYWFSPQPVKTGENIVLYTRTGKNSTETRTEGIYHFLFRHWKNPLYADSSACAVIIEVTTWITTPQVIAPAPPAPRPPSPLGLGGSLFSGLKPK